MAVHRLPEEMLGRPVRVVVVGCGGTGSAVAGGLPYLHQSLLAFGHPFGLHATLVDGDTVSETNCVRQPFSRSEIGHAKAVILATRLNHFWGLRWDAIPSYVGHTGVHFPHADVVIGCVDSRRARAAILRCFESSRYWLDYGNDAESGQFVLGEMPRHRNVGTITPDAFARGDPQITPMPRLPTAADLWPEVVDPELDEGDGPSCSAVEALTRQAPFVNQVLANHGLALLAQFFRRGELTHHGGVVNLATGRMNPLPVPEPPAASPMPTPKRARARNGRGAA